MRVFQANWLRYFILFFIFSPCFIFPPTIYAQIRAIADKAWFLGLGGGVSWIGLANTMSVSNGSAYPPPYNQDRFSINGPTAGIFQLNAGWASSTARRYFPTWSAYLQYRHYFTTNITGHIQQYSIPAFHNYNYQMHYEADLVTLNGKFGLLSLNQLIPYIAGGIGFIINNLNSYTEKFTPGVTPRVSPGYRSHTQTNLAVTLGAGLDYFINRCVTLTLGYDHVFQGSIQSGSGVDTWSNTSLNFGNTKMDTLFLNVSTLFPKN